MSYNEFSRTSAPRRRLAQLSPSTTALRIYQCPANKACRIDAIYVSNIHSGVTDITIHHLAPGETATTSNAMYYQVSVPKNTVLIDDAPKYLLAGDTIMASSSTGAHVVITVYGEEG